MVGPQDKMFMVKAAQGGLMEVQVADLAEQKATREDIKEFARKLKADHTAANQRLMAIAKERQVELPTDPGPHGAMMTKLNGLSGAAFDREWVRMQVQHHRKDVADFRKQSNRGMDSDLKEFASSTLPTLEQHLQTAQSLAANK
jgi:putative membrane protein